MLKTDFRRSRRKSVFACWDSVPNPLNSPDDNEMCRIITVANQKGGVTKTTICQHLSYILAEHGRRVLCVDFDPQTNLSATLLPDGQAPALDISGIITQLLDDQDLPAPL